MNYSVTRRSNTWDAWWDLVFEAVAPNPRTKNAILSAREIKIITSSGGSFLLMVAFHRDISKPNALIFKCQIQQEERPTDHIINQVIKHLDDEVATAAKAVSDFMRQMETIFPELATLEKTFLERSAKLDSIIGEFETRIANLESKLCELEAFKMEAANEMPKTCTLINQVADRLTAVEKKLDQHLRTIEFKTATLLARTRTPGRPLPPVRDIFRGHKNKLPIKGARIRVSKKAITQHAHSRR